MKPTRSDINQDEDALASMDDLAEGARDLQPKPIRRSRQNDAGRHHEIT
jgi:hypothetical protein